MGAAIYRVVCFDTMADDAAATVFARRGKRLDGAFKAIERMRGTSLGDLKGFVVLVAAGFAPCHGNLIPLLVGPSSSLSVGAVNERGKTRRGFTTDLPLSNFHANHHFFVVEPSGVGQ
jgi:hypothetical protein